MKKTTLLSFCLLVLIYGCSNDDAIDPIATEETQEETIEASCSDGIQNGNETGIDCGGDCMPCETSITITGLAQKGPFLNGSSILVSDLDTNFNETGRIFTSEISNNFGNFELTNIALTSSNVSLRVDGFYFNEVCGSQSNAQISLQGITQLVPDEINNSDAINLNVLTHLEKARVEYLINSGLTYSQAKIQALNEVLAIFNIDGSVLTTTSETFDIAGSETGDAILIAVSSMLQGFRTESEFSNLMANIITDIKEDGVLNNAAIGGDLLAHAVLLDANEIASFIEARYLEIGSTITVPEFGFYIDNFINSTNFKIGEGVVTYRPEGGNGPNILNESTPQVTSTFVSMAASIPVDCMYVKIKVNVEGSICNTGYGCWAYDVASVVNWDIDPYNTSENSQLFTSIANETDLRIYFEPGTYLIEYFENSDDLENPTQTKTLIVN